MELALCYPSSFSKICYSTIYQMTSILTSWVITIGTLNFAVRVLEPSICFQLHCRGIKSWICQRLDLPAPYCIINLPIHCWLPSYFDFVLLRMMCSITLFPPWWCAFYRPICCAAPSRWRIRVDILHQMRACIRRIKFEQYVSNIRCGTFLIISAHRFNVNMQFSIIWRILEHEHHVRNEFIYILTNAFCF